MEGTTVYFAVKVKDKTRASQEALQMKSKKPAKKGDHCINIFYPFIDFMINLCVCCNSCFLKNNEFFQKSFSHSLF